MPKPGVTVLEAFSTVNVAIATSNETVVATLNGISPDTADKRISLTGWFQIATVATTTSITLRIRRGTTVAGALVGDANGEALNAAAANTEAHSISVEDTPGEVAGQSYVLTAECPGSATNPTVLQASLKAIF